MIKPPIKNNISYTLVTAFLFLGGAITLFFPQISFAEVLNYATSTCTILTASTTECIYAYNLPEGILDFFLSIMIWLIAFVSMYWLVRKFL